VHQRSCPQLIATRRALDQVRGQRERSTGQPDDRGGVAAARQLAPDDRDRLEDEPEVGSSIDPPEGRDGCVGRHRALDDRTVRPELDVHAHRLDEQHDVGEQDGAIHAERVDRADRHLRTQLGRPRDVHHRVPLAKRQVTREPAARLAHEPHRRRVRHLAPAGRQEPLRAGHRAGTATPA
jgi:hypothetical protein